jgi:hypothetical protein
MRHLLVLVCLALALASGRAAGASGPNADVLKIAYSFKNGGHYNKAWQGSGTPEEIRFQDQRILPVCEGGTYCCGYTFNVAMRAAAERGLLKDKTVAQVRQFQKEWYGTSDADKEKQCALAVQNLGIGRAVPFNGAQPGDFCQLWRGKSGHSVLFLGWIVARGEIVGLRYRSSQSVTDGIGDRVEYFKKIAGQRDPVNYQRTYFCRLNPK